MPHEPVHTYAGADLQRAERAFHEWATRFEAIYIDDQVTAGLLAAGMEYQEASGKAYARGEDDQARLLRAAALDVYEFAAGLPLIEKED